MSTASPLINHTQTKLAEGVGGRKDLVLELRNEWAPVQARHINMHWTEDKIWDAHKSFCQQKMKRLDQQGLITKKKTSANIAFIPNQAEINHDTTAALTNLQNQLAALCDQHREMSSAMSVISQQQTTVPAVIQTTQDNSPTFTQAQCDRQINDLKIYFGKQLDALRGAKASSHDTAATSVLSQGSTKWPSEQRNEQKDSQGRSWFQVKFCCSKHGCNTTHSNEACGFKKSPKGPPWIPGATIQDTKGGNPANADKLNQWCLKSTKQYAHQVPN